MLFLILFLSLMFMLMIYFFYYEKFVPIPLIGITVVIALLNIVSNLVLHVNYYKEDKRKKILIDSENEIIKITKNGNEKIFYYNEIIKVTKIEATSSKLSRYTSSISWRLFYYYRIDFKDNSHQYITRILVQNFEKLIPSIPCEYAEQGYPIIRRSICRS